MFAQLYQLHPSNLGVFTISTRIFITPKVATCLKIFCIGEATNADVNLINSRQFYFNATTNTRMQAFHSYLQFAPGCFQSIFIHKSLHCQWKTHRCNSMHLSPSIIIQYYWPLNGKALMACPVTKQTACQWCWS